eukprot:192703_1
MQLTMAIDCSYQSPKAAAGPRGVVCQRAQLRSPHASWPPSRRRDFPAGLPAVLVGAVFEFLTFAEICGCATLSRHWPRLAGDRMLFERLSSRREEGLRRGVRPDLSIGRGVEFSLKRHRDSDWKQRVLLRERLCCLSGEWNESNMFHVSLLFRKMLEIDCDIGYIEGWRLLAERFVKFEQMFENCNIPQTCVHCPPTLMAKLVTMLVKPGDDPEIRQIGCQALSVLALNESNRAHLIIKGAVKIAIGTLKKHRDRPFVVANALWSLVLLGRPVGGVEGAPFVHQESQFFRAVREIRNLGGIEIVFDILDRFSMCAPVLSRVFWLFVNLALVDSIKREIVQRGGVTRVIEALTEFYDDVEVQHRGIFALINLSIDATTKQQIITLGGPALIVRAMSRFPDNCQLQHCCVCVVRSLVWSASGSTSSDFRRGGMVEMIIAAIRRFPSNPLLQDVAGHALSLLGGL